MFDFFWNLQQENRIAEAKAQASHARDDLSHYKRRIDELEFSLNRVTLASQAVWEILRARLEISQEELLAKINEIDLRDGVQDGRITPYVTNCPKCNRVVNSKSARCIYCGAAFEKPSVFQ